MKLSEIFESSGIAADEKARRVLNTSSAVANITASEIEAGVSLERLESIGVPVYRYQTQVTIHGVLPGFSEFARPAGFKAIFKNGNGTVGVRYVAIDGSKKALIREASYYGPRGWITQLSSTGLMLAHFFSEKADCIAAYKAFPRDLFYGSMHAGAGMYGGFYVLVYVEAVRQESVWRLIWALWGVTGQEDLDKRRADEAARRETERLASEEARQRREAEVARAKSALATRMPLPRLASLPTGEGRFVRVSQSGGEAGLFLYTLKRRGPVLCYAAQRYPATEEPAKFHKFEKWRREKLEDDCRAGLIFAAA